MTKYLHGSHATVAKRLRRAEGHLRSVVAMIEEGRPCLDLAQQLHAIERAVSEAKRVLIRDHIDHCLDDAADATGARRRDAMEEFKQITKYL
jgi:DNA-binding FrmR family transcriptional regulator